MPINAEHGRAARAGCDPATLRYNGAVSYGRRKFIASIGVGMRGMPTVEVRQRQRGGHGTFVSGPVAQWQSTGLITPGSQVRSLPGSPRLAVATGYSGVVSVT